MVWVHNSHLGDASATAMGDRGELNVGQLARERCGDSASRHTTGGLRTGRPLPERGPDEPYEPRRE